MNKMKDFITNEKGKSFSDACCYLTLSNCDFVFVMKLSDYKKGMDVIANLNNQFDIRYPYTIPCYSDAYYNPECKISKVCIQLTMTYETAFDDYYKSIQNISNSVYQKCGHDDYAIFLYDYLLSDVVMLLKMVEYFIIKILNSRRLLLQHVLISICQITQNKKLRISKRRRRRYGR